MKIVLNKPVLFMVYGFPGSGKTHFARQFCEELQAIHLQADRIRYELFETPRYDKQENEVVMHLMQYMAEEFLNVGVSVVFDINAMRLSGRRELREFVRKKHASTLLLWFQIDPENAYLRLTQRDRRKTDDKYATPMPKETFEKQIGYMQNPDNEEYVVLSGRHTFQSQRNAVMKKLHDQGLIDVSAAHANMAKPGLVNLIPSPQPGRVDQSRRNISIR